MLRNTIFLIIQCFLFGLVKLTHFLCWLIQCKRWQQKLAGKNKSVLFLDPFFPENAGYHWRAAKWSKILNSNGIKAKVKCVVRGSMFYLLVNKALPKLHIIFLVKRYWHCLLSLKYQTVIVRREILLFNDYGNLFMEKFLLSIHPNVILDFDDDIAASKGQPKKVKSLFGRLMLENGNKFNESLRLFKRFIVASNYLKEKVQKENPSVDSENILVIPTCVDYEKWEPKHYDLGRNKISLGWIGGNQNQHYLDKIIPALNKISNEAQIELIVISGKPYQAEARFPIKNIAWSLEEEVESMREIDVGLMPLPENKATAGKGGFKLIQYMGLGIVSVASAITINNEIIDHGNNGFLVEPEGDWTSVLEKVFSQRKLFPEVGKQARDTILKSYTFEANTQAYIEFVKRA